VDPVMAEPLLVMVKTASPPLHDPETLTLDLSHPVSVDDGVFVAVLTGVLVAVLTGVLVLAGVLVDGMGVLVAVLTDVLVAVLAGVFVGGRVQFPVNLTEPLKLPEKPSDHVALTLNVTFPD
jgi:hypothetical protein